MFHINYHVLVLGQYTLKDYIFLKLIFFLKCIRKMENFWEENEISLSCKGTLKHCNFSCHFMIGFVHCKLLDFGKSTPRSSIHTDIVIVT